MTIMQSTSTQIEIKMIFFWKILLKNERKIEIFENQK